VPPPVATAPLAGATPTVTPTGTPTAAATAPPLPLWTSVVVRPGDTLWAIAQRYGRTVNELLNANREIGDRSLIRVGDKIAIPSDDVHALWNATFDLPALPVPAADVVSLLPGCLQGRVTFVDGSAFPPGVKHEWYNGTWIERVVWADVDHDGTTDVVALIKCQPSQGSFDRVVAFRERPDGTFATIGLVLQLDWGAETDPNTIEDLESIDATPGGEILIDVYGTVCSCDRAVFPGGVSQRRTYGWNGQAFVQTAGSTTLVVPPGAYDLSVSASTMTYAKPVDGLRAGTMTVTLRNNGASAVEDLSVLVGGMESMACADPGPAPGGTCTIGRLAPGATRTVTLYESCHSDSGCGNDPPPELQVLIGDQQYDSQPVHVIFN
jgi:LysM repeat protein